MWQLPLSTLSGKQRMIQDGSEFCRSETKLCTMHAHPHLQASPAHSLVVSEQYVFCGCSEGVVRIFDPCTLDYLITVPKPHSLGVDVAAALDSRCVGGHVRGWMDVWVGGYRGVVQISNGDMLEGKGEPTKHKPPGLYHKV